MVLNGDRNQLLFSKQNDDHPCTALQSSTQLGKDGATKKPVATITVGIQAGKFVHTGKVNLESGGVKSGEPTKTEASSLYLEKEA